MNNKFKVDGHSNLYRDALSGAVINSNIDEFERYKKTKMKRESLYNEINTLRKEISEIKQLLKDLKK
jgi:hypothetical protein